MRHYLIFLLLFLPPFLIAGEHPLTDGEVDQLLISYKEIIDSQPTGVAKYNMAFINYDYETSLYRLFIDKERLKNPEGEEKNVLPCMLFDVKEPGYHKSMTVAFSYLGKSCIGQKVDLDTLITLHDLAVASVNKMKKGLAECSWCMEVGGIGTLEKEEAFNELFLSAILDVNEGECFLDVFSGQDKKDNEKKEVLRTIIGPKIEETFLAIITVKQKKEVIAGLHTTKEQLIVKLASLFDHYYQSLEQTKTLQGRLNAIGELIRALEVAHFFPDGNQRTYAFLLLTKLLIDNGIPPAILDDPGMFDGHKTVGFMGLSIKKGIRNFLNAHSKRQRAFLEQSKGTKVDPDLYHFVTSPSDYEPYFSKKPVEQIALKIKAQIVSEINGIAKANVNEPMPKPKKLPLVLAVALDSSELVDMLLEKGASPFGALETRYPLPALVPFAMATESGNVLLMKKLIDKMTPELFLKVNKEFLLKAAQETAEMLVQFPEHELILLEILEKVFHSQAKTMLSGNRMVRSYLDDWAGDNEARIDTIKKVLGIE